MGPLYLPSPLMAVRSRSKTWTSKPRLSSATASTSPPIPAPAIRTFMGRTPLCASTDSSGMVAAALHAAESRAGRQGAAPRAPEVPATARPSIGVSTVEVASTAGARGTAGRQGSSRSCAAPAARLCIRLDSIVEEFGALSRGRGRGRGGLALRLRRAAAGRICAGVACWVHSSRVVAGSAIFCEPALKPCLGRTAPLAARLAPLPRQGGRPAPRAAPGPAPPQGTARVNWRLLRRRSAANISAATI
jgi:hypothetical protein